MSIENKSFLEEVEDFLNQTAGVVGNVAQGIADNQRGMAEKNAPQPRQRFDPKAYGQNIAKIDAKPNQRLSRTNSSSSAGSGSDGRSSSGSGSSSYGSTGTAESGNTASVVKAVTALADKDRLKEEVPLHSPPKPSKSEGDKKAPTQLPGCTTGIKKAFSSCCSCLFNGLSSLIKKLNASTSEGQDLSSKEVPSREKKQEKKEVPEKNFFKSFRTVVKKVWEKEHEVVLSKLDYNKENNAYKLKAHSTHKLGSLSQFTNKVRMAPGEVATMGVSGARSAGRGVRSFGGGVSTVAENAFKAAKFMATPGERSGKTWREQFESVGRLTEGMGSSNSGYGIGTAALGAGAFAYSAVLETPKAVTPGTRAAEFARDFTGSIAGGGASMVSRLSEVRMSAIVPTAFR